MLRGIFLDSDIMYLSLEAWKVKSKYNLGFVSCHNPSYIVKDQKVKMKVTQYISDECALVNGSSIFNSFLMPNRQLFEVESVASISLNLSNGMEWGMWVDEGPSKS